MTMREEAKRAAVAVLRKRHWDLAADSVEEEREEDSYYASTATNAMLDVIDQYKEVEVEECRFLSGGVPMHILRFRDSHSFGTDYGNPVRCTILRRRKQKPDVKELARQAVKAWREHRIGVADAMDALAKELDK
jgi:hypothetical protein